jgi:hypothetical protein
MSVPDAVMDLNLDKIATGTRVSICSGEPANFAGIAAVSLGEVTVGGSDFAKANGDTSGRKLTLGALTGITPSANGTVTYLAIDDGSALLKTVPVTSQAVTTAQTWSSPATKIWEIKDPTYS